MQRGEIISSNYEHRDCAVQPVLFFLHSARQASKPVESDQLSRSGCAHVGHYANEVTLPGRNETASCWRGTDVFFLSRTATFARRCRAKEPVIADSGLFTGLGCGCSCVKGKRALLSSTSVRVSDYARCLSILPSFRTWQNWVTQRWFFVCGSEGFVRVCYTSDQYAWCDIYIICCRVG